MKVLHVVPKLGYDGVSQMVLSLGQEMVGLGIEFEIVSHGNPVDFYLELEKKGIKIRCVPFAGEVGLIRYLVKMFNIMRTFGSYDVVHVHTNYQAGFVCLMAWLAGIPVRVSHIHGTLIDDRHLPWIWFYRFMLVLWCNVRLSVNDAGANMYYGKAVSCIFPMALDPSRFHFELDARVEIRNEFDLGRYDLVLGHVGRFSSEKRHEFLMDIVEELGFSDVNVCLICVGDGPLRGEIESKIDRMKYGHLVKLIAPRSDINRILSAIDVLLLPSSSEGLPCCVIEAQAVGIPAIVSSVVTRKVDIGLGLVQFVDTASVGPWVSAILNIPKINLNKEEISTALSENNYHLRGSARKMVELYSQRGKCSV